MPVTTRLLHRLNEALGDDAADDLLACFREASEVNRAAVRELAELYITRSEARIDQRMAELRGDLHSALDVHRGEIGSALAELRGEFRSSIGELRGEFRSALGAFRGEMRSDLANQRAELLKWMFLFWAGTVVPLAGLLLALRGPR
ncbi:MAG: hypothetical protein HOP28_17270 [Gemmatimonadales bacterium]|nr:hypothetical protein [Gemmatimonadales bacterium]